MCCFFKTNHRGTEFTEERKEVIKINGVIETDLVSELFSVSLGKAKHAHNCVIITDFLIKG